MFFILYYKLSCEFDNVKIIGVYFFRIFDFYNWRLCNIISRIRRFDILFLMSILVFNNFVLVKSEIRMVGDF